MVEQVKSCVTKLDEIALGMSIQRGICNKEAGGGGEESGCELSRPERM